MIIDTNDLDPGMFDRLKAYKTRSEAEEAWIRQRGGRMTASSVWQLFTSKLAVANSATVEKYIYEKIAEKLGAYQPNLTNKAVQWGHNYELEAVEHYEARTGAKVDKKGEEQEFIPHLEFGGCTPDGLIGKDGGLQVKCPYNPSNHIKYLLMKSPEDLKEKEYKYYVQVQTEMMVTERQWWDFVSYDPRIEREDAKIKILRCYPDTSFVPVLKEAIEKANDQMLQLLIEIEKL